VGAHLHRRRQLRETSKLSTNPLWYSLSNTEGPKAQAPQGSSADTLTLRQVRRLSSAPGLPVMDKKLGVTQVAQTCVITLRLGRDPFSVRHVMRTALVGGGTRTTSGRSSPPVSPSAL